MRTSCVFLASEALFQAGTFLFGVWVIRSLSKDNYAIYALASAASAFAAILVNSGMNVGFKKIAGKVFSDSEKFRRLYSSGVEQRKRQSVVILPVTGMVVFIILLRQGCGWVSGIGISLLILLIILPDISRSTQIEALLVQRKWSIVQAHNFSVLSLKAAIFGLIVILVGRQISVFGALGASAIAAWTGAAFIVLVGRKWWSPRAPADPNYSLELKCVSKKVLPNAVFFSVQNQMGVLLLGVLGSGEDLAGFGVLSRLTIAFGIFSALFTNVFSPAYSRCHNWRALRFLYYGNIGFQIVFAISVVGVCSLVPNYVLSIFGPKYEGLESSLNLAVWLAVFGFANTTVLRLNQAKGWIDIFSKWSIPFTLAAFAIGALLCNLMTLNGVLLFTLLTRFPGFCLRIADGVFGLRELNAGGARI